MKVELLSAAPSRQRIVLDELPVVLGRDNGVQVHVEDSWVGNKQCIIDQDGDTLRVLDLGSRTGTFVNGRRVARATLLPGDRLVLGKTEFLVQYEPQSLVTVGP